MLNNRLAYKNVYTLLLSFLIFHNEYTGYFWQQVRFSAILSAEILSDKVHQWATSIPVLCAHNYYIMLCGDNKRLLLHRDLAASHIRSNLPPRTACLAYRVQRLLGCGWWLSRNVEMVNYHRQRTFLSFFHIFARLLYILTNFGTILQDKEEIRLNLFFM